MPKLQNNQNMNNYEFLLTFIKNQKFDSKHYFPW